MADNIKDGDPPEPEDANQTAQTVWIGAPGAPPAPPDELHLPTDGSLLDRGVLSHGGMSAIRRVFDRNILREVALKTLLPGRAMARESSLLLDEARITGQLEHPNIVPLYDLRFDPSGAPVFTMKLIDGCTFTDYLRERPHQPGGRPLHDALQVFLKVCEAVSFAHSRGVIHRDLKPDNIMVGSHGQVYVVDWGCALVVDSPDHPVALGRPPRSGPFEQPGVVVGTAAYMAPEQAHGRTEQLDARVDVFSLGAILYFLLTGVPPYPVNHHAVALALAQRGEIVPPAERVPGVALPDALCQIAMTAMATAPDERHASVGELKQAVERALEAGLWLTSRTFRAGTVIFDEGDPADAAYIITAGDCEVFRIEHGRRVTLRRMGVGEVFGETAILTQQPRSAGVAAVGEVTTVVVTREALESELCGQSWAGAFVRALAHRFRDLDSKLRELQRNATGRESP